MLEAVLLGADFAFSLAIYYEGPKGAKFKKQKSGRKIIWEWSNFIHVSLFVYIYLMYKFNP